MRKKYTYAENYNVAIRQPALKSENVDRKFNKINVDQNLTDVDS